jgi:hypothetical protein
MAKAKKAPELKFDTGLKRIPITFIDREEQDFISFNPTDMNLPIRLKKAEANINQRLEDYKDIEFKPDGTPEDEKYIDAFEEMTKIVSDEIDRAFNGHVSDSVFKHCNPLSIVNEKYYVMTFIEQIGEVIEYYVREETETGAKKANENMNKYLDKYGKRIGK